MKLPKSFTIKGEEWSVGTAGEIEGAWGEADTDTRTIIMDSALKGRKLKEILLHEFIHACLHELHVDLEDGVEEVLADGLAKCLLDSFHVRPR